MTITRRSALAFGAAGAIFAPHVARSQEVTLRGVSAFPRSMALTDDFVRFIDKVNAVGKGIVQIRLIGGPEITPVQEQGNALASGLFDVLFGPPVYYVGRFPESDMFSGLLRPAADIRKDGGDAILNDMFQRRAGAEFLAFAGGQVGLYVFTSREPKMLPSGAPDLTGMRMRSSPLYKEFLDAVGATPVVMSFGEIFPALERGLVEGTAWNLIGVVESGWSKFLKYRIEPEIYRSSVMISMNLAKFRGLSAEARKVLNDASKVYEVELEAFYKEREQKERAAQDAAGIKAITLSASGGAAIQKIAMDTMWARVKANSRVQADFERIDKIFYGRG